MAPVTHVVLFRFKQGVTVQSVQNICSLMLALKENCKHPETQKPYIKSMSGGKDISIENLQDGITHGFVAEFNSVDDRDYYVNKDPAHQAFVAEVTKVAEKAQVVDFTPGAFD